MDIAFGAAYAGFGLALVALVAGIANGLKLGWSALVIYAGLFVASLFAVGTCG